MSQCKLKLLCAPTQLLVSDNLSFWAQRYNDWESTLYFTEWNEWLKSLAPTKVQSSSVSSLKKLPKIGIELLRLALASCGETGKVRTDAEVTL